MRRLLVLPRLRVERSANGHDDGDAWFEGLRPHLPTKGEAAKYRNAHEVHCDNPTLMLLSLEIGRIEKEWTEEANGRRRRRWG